MADKAASPENLALSVAAARLAGDLRDEANALVDLAQHARDGRWADMMHTIARWVKIEELTKRHTEILHQVFDAIPKATIQESLKRTGLSAEEVAAIAGLGGTDGWD